MVRSFLKERNGIMVMIMGMNLLHAIGLYKVSQGYIVERDTY